MLTLLALMLADPESRLQPAPPPLPHAEVVATRLSVPPRVDGVLDDVAWSGEPASTGEWGSYNPLYGGRVPQQTRVWVGYDDDALYFAFECDDPDPGGIKTSVARRDNFGADDWVGLSLDALGTGQLAYHMMVNPSGVQLDLLNSVAGGEDWTVDWVWESGGRVTDTGYSVEIRLPLRSIRFASGRDVRMGILFWRRVSRLGMSVAWPAIEAGRWVFDTHAPLMLTAVESRLPRDVTPSVTFSGRQGRATSGAWGPFRGVRDVGVSAKLGLTTTVTLDATLNPDFSQVESDAFQVEVNQRFPVFFSERRPFFMEGAGIFSLAGTGGDNTLQTAVHTRRIVNPIAGLKLTGSAGRTTIAALSAVDEGTGVATGIGGTSSKSRVFTIGRAQFSLGPGNYIGTLATSVEGANGHNRVVGGDLSFRLSNAQRVTSSLLVSRSGRVGGGATDAMVASAGLGTTAAYSYNTRAMGASASIEHYDRGFQMDTAFINRVGVTSGTLYLERNVYPRGPLEWMRRVALFSFAQGGVDRLNDGADFLESAGVRVNFTRQGFVRVDRTWGYEPWRGERFRRGRLRTIGRVQLTRWLELNGRFETGRAVFYDPSQPFAGHSRRAGAGLVFQPSGRLLQSVSSEYVTFDRRSTGERVYSVTIVNTRTIYQFTRRLYARALTQFDSSRHRILTDYLLSYEVNPGTIAYVGYGGLFHRLTDEHQPAGPRGPFSATDRVLLFKVSYLARF